MVEHFKHSVATNTELRKNQELLSKSLLNIKQDVSHFETPPQLYWKDYRRSKTLFLLQFQILRNVLLIDAQAWSPIADCNKLLKPLDVMTVEISRNIRQCQ